MDSCKHFLLVRSVRRSVSAAIREPAGLIAQKIRIDQAAFVAQARIAIGFRQHRMDFCTQSDQWRVAYAQYGVFLRKKRL